jgi:Ca2+-dependent lipid-binding protein
MSKEPKEKKLENQNGNSNISEQSVLEDCKSFRERQYTRAVCSVGIFIALAWLLGRFEFGFFWLLGLMVFVILWWKCKISWLLELVCKDADLEARRERAFHDTETVEWLNFILNRW